MNNTDTTDSPTTITVDAINHLARSLTKQLSLFGPEIRQSTRLIAAAILIHPSLTDHTLATPSALAQRAIAIVDALERELTP